jgi:hypothetical protein
MFGKPNMVLQVYDIQRITQIVDYITLVTYNFNIPEDRVTGHNSPLFSSDGQSAVSIQNFLNYRYRKIWSPMDQLPQISHFLSNDIFYLVINKLCSSFKQYILINFATILKCVVLLKLWTMWEGGG